MALPQRKFSKNVENNTFAKGRLKSGEMNKTEQDYADVLEQQKQAGEILWYKFEGLTFKLALDTRYTPDFVVLTNEGYLECREVKGYWLGDAKAKIKVAAALFPIKFIAVKKVPKKHGGGWSTEDF